MKILLTGVTGFVGSHLSQYLYAKGFSVYCLIRKPIEDENLKSKLCNVQLRVFTEDSLADIISDINPDLVIHLASLYLTVHKYDQIENLIQSNITFPTKLLEAMSANNVTKIINTGTSWQHYKSAQYDPVNLYAATKQAFEDIIKFYVSAKSFSCITLKLFDTYGPDDTRGKLISLLDNLSLSKDLLAMSPGEQVVEITHIDDVCAAYMTAISQIMTMQAGESHAYGVDSNSRLKLKDLVSEYERANGVKLNVKWGERPYREREVMQPCFNLNNIPGWEPVIKLIHGLNRHNR
jgi:nucleoside-diphosphate-sugar epimerase